MYDGLDRRIVLRSEEDPAALDSELQRAVTEGMVLDVYTTREGWVIVVDESPEETQAETSEGLPADYWETAQ